MSQSSGGQTTGQSTGGQSTGGQGSSEQAGTEGSRVPTARGGADLPKPADEPSTGKTTIAASVVQKISGIAAREISGVHAMGGGVSRAFGALRERIPGGTGTSSTSGVQVEVGEKQAAVDLDIIVEYGASIVDLARAVRRNVINSVERMTGLDVIEVNIAVNDIHLPSDDEGNEAEAASSSRVE
ncbi:Asp23/Gls24 family envelope stress response protein [Parasphingorhabdus pacifica]